MVMTTGDFVYLYKAGGPAHRKVKFYVRTQHVFVEFYARRWWFR